MTFGGDSTELGRRFLQEIKNEVRIRAFPVPYAKTILAYAKLGIGRRLHRGRRFARG